MPVPIACGAAVVAAVTIFTTPTGPAVPGKIPGVVLVTLLWTWNLYQIVGAQVLVNMGQGSRLNPAAKHVSERIMGNIERAVQLLRDSGRVDEWFHSADDTTRSVPYSYLCVPFPGCR